MVVFECRLWYVVSGSVSAPSVLCVCVNGVMSFVCFVRFWCVFSVCRCCGFGLRCSGDDRGQIMGERDVLSDRTKPKDRFALQHTHTYTYTY